MAEPRIVIEWGGKVFEFASAAEALKAGFHVNTGPLPAKPEEKK
jgi:hypothetical protein